MVITKVATLNERRFWRNSSLLRGVEVGGSSIYFSITLEREIASLTFRMTVWFLTLDNISLLLVVLPYYELHGNDNQ